MHDALPTDQATTANREHAPDQPGHESDPVVWRRITGDHLILWAACCSFGMSTSIAAMISYKHAHRIAVRYGETGIDAAALPLTVDGLVATASLVILYRIRKGRRPPWHAWALLIVAVIATVCANVANGLAHGPVGAIVAGWPALVAVGSFELLMRLLRDRRHHRAPVSDTPDDPAPHHPDSPPEHDGLEEPDPGPVPDLAPDIVAAALHFATDLADGTCPSIRRLKRELHIGHAKASAIHRALAARPFPPEDLTPAA
ncbi:DUF2637 domain-containing protein [Actinocorallia sp. A-T 12471]|uniref:DUF2637 domain-containing protein n=1 Tax=Actinocorallia sp. A-T 12471 TaxID=3089813 RepID=UPI0029D1AFA1|nr:DUF2637 domain-containing protein [Actinocorallia sp. A-T 12471]MDX6740451.1 DUF2637 domain-containing protein [Actinocorallia sp. A-T 12471]